MTPACNRADTHYPAILTVMPSMSQGQLHPALGRHIPPTVTAADGTHPTGMLSF